MLVHQLISRGKSSNIVFHTSDPVTYNQLLYEFVAYRNYFYAQGIRIGENVGLFSRNSAEFVYCYMALSSLGAVVVPLNFQLTAREIAYIVKDAQMKHLVSMEALDIRAELLQHDYSEEITQILIPELAEIFASQFFGTAPSFDSCINESAPCVIIYTSGTTGNPKMVTLDYLYPLGHIITAKYWHNLHEDSLHLTIADTGWLKAVWGKLYGQWIVGACVFVYDHEKFAPADILRKIEKHKVTSLCAPPTIFRFLIREDLTKYDLSSLEYCTIAGEALNPEVYHQFYRLTGIKLREGYGQSETTLSVLTTPFVEPKPGSMGMPSPQYDVDVVTPDGRSAEVGEEGQIVIRTDKSYPEGLFKGYYRNKQLTDECYHNNIYYTGDVVWKDEDGYFWFVGRADDVIKSSGYRIGPFEVESALMTHPAVVECAITGVPDEIRGQVVKATIILSNEYKEKAGEELIKEIQNHVKHVTAPYKYPRIIEFVDELPKTISGKIRRTEIRAKDNFKK